MQHPSKELSQDKNQRKTVHVQRMDTSYKTINLLIVHMRVLSWLCELHTDPNQAKPTSNLIIFSLPVYSRWECMHVFTQILKQKKVFSVSVYSSSVIPNIFCEEFHILVIEEHLYVACIFLYSLNQKFYATEARLTPVSKLSYLHKNNTNFFLPCRKELLFTNFLLSGSMYKTF